MFKKIACIIIVLSSAITFAQVGINTTDPKAIFDVEASNRVSPSNTDGLLVPRVDAFPTTNPGADQQGMLLYLTTISGTNNPGMYMWNNGTSSWVNINKAVTNLLEDTDQDTKIQVEETADEDIIRFDVGGTEYFSMKGTRLEVNNTGGSIFIGKNTGRVDDLTANINLFVGNGSGQSNTTGEYNIGLGHSSLKQNINGNYNVGIGLESLTLNISGQGNSTLGFRSLQNNISGELNVAIGRQAGRNSIGSGNVFLGAYSGTFETNSNRLYIENTNSNSPLIYGEFDNDVLRVNGELQIGTAFSFPVVDGTNNQVLSTDGAGNVIWQTVSTPSSSLLIDTDGDTKIQVEETADEDIIRFDTAGTEYFNMNAGRLNVENTGFSVFLGRNAGLNDDLANRNNVFVGDLAGTSNTTGYFNVAIGSRALRSNTTGLYNTALGGQALGLNTTGNQNTVIGMEAMLNNSSGSNNIAVGRNALHDNTTGIDNVSVGTLALSSNTTGNLNNALGSGTLLANTTGIHNSAFGFNAMTDNTIGTRNSAFGNNALRNNTSGAYNTAIGYIALDVNTTGSDNVAVGYNAGKNSTGSDNLFLGTQAGLNQTAGDNNIIIGTNVDVANLTGNDQLNIGNLIEGNLTTGAFSVADDFNVLPDGSVLMKAAGGTFDVGITQNSSVGGAATMELTTTDGLANQATRLLLRGNSNGSDIEFYRGASGSEVQSMHIEGTTGNVGIGTNTTTQAKLVVNGSTTSNQTYGFLNPSGATGTATATGNYSIWASDKIAATAFNAISDERVKNIIGVSNSSEDLENLMKVEITNYTMKDTIQYGNKAYKKVIAQDLNKVYSQAVSKSTLSVIPNIYRVAKINEEGYITIDNSSLVVGDKVKLISNKFEELVEVLALDGKGFKVESELKGEVFVYGKQVDDFHTVDYEAISMLNVSATQELYKSLKKQQIEIENLRNEHSKLSSEVSEIKAMLMSLNANNSNN